MIRVSRRWEGCQRLEEKGKLVNQGGDVGVGVLGRCNWGEDPDVEILASTVSLKHSPKLRGSDAIMVISELPFNSIKLPS